MLLAADTVDPLARTLGIYGAVVATGAIIWQVYSHKATGPRIRVKRLTIETDYYDSYETKVVVTIVNNGRMPGRIEEVGIIRITGDGSAFDADIGKRLKVDVRLPHERQPVSMAYDIPAGARVVGEATMGQIVEHWFPGGELRLKGWVRLGTGKPKMSFGNKRVTTPPPRRQNPDDPDERPRHGV